VPLTLPVRAATIQTMSSPLVMALVALDDVAAFLAFPLAGIVLFLGWRWHFRRAESQLHQWAERCCYRILMRKYRLFLRGPFYWNSSSGQAVYRGRVADREGVQREGWLRVGSWLWGVTTDQVDLLWDDEGGRPKSC
jgi:hypothetical protein